jgi:hypothetical protein
MQEYAVPDTLRARMSGKSAVPYRALGSDHRHLQELHPKLAGQPSVGLSEFETFNPCRALPKSDESITESPFWSVRQNSNFFYHHRDEIS